MRASVRAFCAENQRPAGRPGITCTVSTPARTVSAALALRRRRTRVSSQAASECGSTSLSTSEPATFGASKYRGGGLKSISMQQ